MHEAAAAERPNNAEPRPALTIERAVRTYFSQIEIGAAQIRILEGTENANEFAALLTRLGGTAEYRMPGFSNRVAIVIQTLAEAGSAELRANCYLQAQDGLNTCADQVAITFSDIEVACRVHRIVRGGGQGEMVRLLRGLFRMDALDHIARTDIAGRSERFDEDIEVLLAYRVRLREQLDLPFESRAMHHADIAGLNRDTLDRAREHVLNLERDNNGSALVDFAIAQPFWNTFLENNQEFQQRKENIAGIFDDRLEQLEDRSDTISSDAYVRELNNLAARRQATINDLQREFTRNMISLERA